jgi:hypothetical protein
VPSAWARVSSGPRAIRRLDRSLSQPTDPAADRMKGRSGGAASPSYVAIVIGPPHLCGGGAGLTKDLTPASRHSSRRVNSRRIGGLMGNFRIVRLSGGSVAAGWSIEQLVPRCQSVRLVFVGKKGDARTEVRRLNSPEKPKNSRAERRLPHTGRREPDGQGLCRLD